MGVELMTCPDSPSHGLQEVKSSNSTGGLRVVTLACGYVGAYVAATMAPPSLVAAGEDLEADGNFVGDQDG